jgi:hypothetical protein
MNEQKMIDLVNRIADNDKVAPFQNGFVVLSNEEMVRYTELIVQECIDTVSDCSIEYCTRPQIVSEIKEHFGVEE